MFEPAGTLYVYRSYGLHWCANVVTGPAGDGQAVLVRAVLVVAGEELAAERRRGVARRHWSDGPGKVCTALGITGADDGCNLMHDPVLGLYDDGSAVVSIRKTPRIGITKAVDVPWRWCATIAADGPDRRPRRPRTHPRFD